MKTVGKRIELVVKILFTFISTSCCCSAVVEVSSGEGGAQASEQPAIKSSESFDSSYQKDAYLLFRALCKLSTKGFQDESTTSTDAVIHQNKLV